MKQERLAALKEQVNTLIKEAEHLGEEGNIDEAQLKLEESEKLKSECKYLENVRIRITISYKLKQITLYYTGCKLIIAIGDGLA